MAEQRQPFRLRLPWLTAAPQPSPAPRPSPEPSQPAPPPAERRPFRPAGAGPARPPARPPTRAEAAPPPPSRIGTQTQTQPASQLASPPRITPPSRAAPPPASPSPSQAVPQTQITSQPSSTRITTPSRAPPPTSPSGAPPASPSRAVPRAQVTSQPTSPARVTQPARQKATTPPPSPSTSTTAAPKGKPTITTKNQPSSTTTKISQPQKEPLKLQEPQPEVVIEPVEGQKKQPEETTKPKTDISGQIPESNHNQQPIRAVYWASPTKKKEMLKDMDHEEPKPKTVDDTRVPGSKAEEHPLAVTPLDERGQHPQGEVFDGGKEVLKTVTDIQNHEKVSRISHKPAIAGREKDPLHKGTKEDSPKPLHNKLGVGRSKHPLHEKPHSIVTLTGQNTGATMQLNSGSSERERSIHIHRGYKTNPEESGDTTTDGEGSSRGRKSGDTDAEDESAAKIYLNNNAQGINNSLVFNSSVTERNPGVHLVLSRSSVEPTRPRKEPETLEARKAEVATTPAERLAYVPTIRRRCLRGLFLESSDSDPEHPEKPRRHGCRVGCRQKGKDNIVDVL